MILAESKQLPDLTVMSENTLFKWCKKNRRIKKMQVYQQFDVDVVSPVCNSIKKDSGTGFF